jgi:uncharacterized CHY-type Zn-finger protein
MCKHILNAQVSIRASCCKEWFDCPECHKEYADHELRKTVEMVFACKKCKKVFRKDMDVFEEADEYCPYCDNHYILPAVTAQEQPIAAIQVPAYDSRCPNREMDFE